MVTTFPTDFSQLNLSLPGQTKNSPLQAWNAADELLLQRLQQELESSNLAPSLNSVLIVNDAYGALMVALADAQPQLWTDSFCSLQAWQHNARLNAQDGSSQQMIASTEPLTKQYDLVLIKMPKSLALLKYQLLRLRPHLHANSLVLLAGMVKYLSPNMIACVEQYLGPTQVSRAQKKARLLHPQITSQIESLPDAADLAEHYQLPDSKLQIHSEPGVFSQQKPDPGTLLMINQLDSLLPQLPPTPQIVDLGCGNGALGCYLASRVPGANLLFCDESYLAVASAQRSWQLNQLDPSDTSASTAQFKVTDGLSGLSSEFDLVLLNPPFHQGNRLDQQAALRLFRDSKRHLKPSGTLVVVGNRHLGYHQSLRRYFSKVKILGSNPKFVVLAASNNHNVPKD